MIFKWLAERRRRKAEAERKRLMAEPVYETIPLRDRQKLYVDRRRNGGDPQSNAAFVDIGGTYPSPFSNRAAAALTPSDDRVGDAPQGFGRTTFNTPAGFEPARSFKTAGALHTPTDFHTGGGFSSHSSHDSGSSHSSSSSSSSDSGSSSSSSSSSSDSGSSSSSSSGGGGGGSD